VREKLLSGTQVQTWQNILKKAFAYSE